MWFTGLFLLFNILLSALINVRRYTIFVAKGGLILNTALRIKAFLLSILAVIIFIFTIAFLGADVYKSPRLHELVQLDEGWTVNYATNTYYPEVLSKTVMPVANMNDVITATCVLPDIQLEPAVLHFRTILSTCDVYLDNKLIYDFGHDYEEAGQMLPKFHHFVALPKDYPGKEIKLVITAKENNAFSGLSPVELGNEEDIARSVAQDGRLSLAIGVFLVMIGFVMVILAPMFIFSGNHDISIVFSGLISMMLGLYILCFNDLFWLFSDQPPMYTFVEYISLYCIPMAMIGFLTAANHIPHKKVGIVIWIINTGFALTTALLHVTNIVHICHFVSYLHLIAIVEGVYIIAALIIVDYKRCVLAEEYVKANKSTTMLIIGLILFLGCSVIDIIKFNILKFLSIGEVNAKISFMTVGAFIFILCLILNYFYHCIEFISETNTKQKLEGLAYSDSLTSLANRSKCELTMAELSGEYTILSVDLDHLKYTNDNHGHAEGDKLISGFSDILKNSFTDASLIGRMGGDEFIIILPYVDEPRTRRDLACFEDLMNYHNSEKGNIKYSASYGFATSTEEGFNHDVNSQQVYLLADTRMYKMKMRHHSETLGRLCNDIINDPKSKEDNADV